MLKCRQLGNKAEKTNKAEVGGGSRSFESAQHTSFGLLGLHRERLTKPCKRHRTGKILAFLLPRSPLVQETVESSSLTQIQPLEKLHSSLITSVAAVVATEGFPRARVELSFALRRGLFEVEKSRVLSCFAKVAFLESVWVLTLYQQTLLGPFQLLAALPGVLC